MSELTTTSAVIKALGGIGPTAKLTNRDYDAAEQWKRKKHFPPDTYLALKKALEASGHTAPPSLWRMVETAS